MTQSTDWINHLPPAFKTYQGDRRIYEVECMIPDFAGVSRGKAMPAGKFGSGLRSFLPSSIFYQTITGNYADLEINDQWTEVDLVLVPDMATACAAPWADDVTLQIIHDVYDKHGNAVSLAPRNVLKHVIGLYEAQGWRPIVAPELEFYLTQPNTDPAYPIEPSIGRTGRKGVGRQSYSITAVDEYGKVVDDIYDFAEAQGLEIASVIQEGGAGQLEINLMHSDPLRLADEVFLFKRTIREAALRHNCFATFMAKPMSDQPGSAMHIHQSVVDIETGKNIFSAKDGTATDAFYHFIGGCQKHFFAATSLFAPYVNSYRRYSGGDSAPTNIEWASDNRTTGLRIPVSSADSRRIENRVVGMDSNPYLAIAASLACGYLGMVNSVKPREAASGEGYGRGLSLPRSLYSALKHLGRDTEFRQTIGEQFCMVYEGIKLSELEDFHSEISPWEREYLLLSV
ncbi:glutamine synthetase [Rhizobium sp. SG_E_25_P2]|uniref:glutamine synthetase family protein n=1 Tax=Rhizobium sp. SG_E_25_P2 TaxID=2879942 RepID=UPI0024733A03|nr:glutamine synthetase family protein [Rhizobium sp. SG_E_25_P2]MDH6265981.1 glutamine synthetase [Rhizobium sp. SG_E_25_P2]